MRRHVQIFLALLARTRDGELPSMVRAAKTLLWTTGVRCLAERYSTLRDVHKAGAVPAA